MTLQDHKRLDRFYTAPLKYKYLCREYQGSLLCVAALLRIYIFATREIGQALDFSEPDLESALEYDWSAKPIRTARTFLVRSGFLVLARGGGRGQRPALMVDFDRIEKAEREMPADWEARFLEDLKSGRVRQKCRTSKPPRQNDRPRQISRTAPAKVPVFEEKTPAKVPDLAAVSINKELASSSEEKKLASPPPAQHPPKTTPEAELWALLGGFSIGGSPVSPQTIAVLADTLRKFPTSLWPAAFRKIADVRHRARTWGLFQSILAADIAPLAANAPRRASYPPPAQIEPPGTPEASNFEPNYRALLAAFPNHVEADFWRSQLEGIPRKPVGSELGAEACSATR